MPLISMAPLYRSLDPNAMAHPCPPGRSPSRVHVVAAGDASADDARSGAVPGAQARVAQVGHLGHATGGAGSTKRSLFRASATPARRLLRRRDMHTIKLLLTASIPSALVL